MLERMLRRWFRTLDVKLYRMRRNIFRSWRVDMLTGIMGILTLTSCILLLVIIGNGFSKIYRYLLPWVAGSRVGEVYWQSIGFGIMMSFVFLIFSVSLIIFFLLRTSGRR